MKAIVLALLAAGCGGAAPPARTGAAPREPEETCRVGDDTSRHLALLSARAGSAVTLEPGVAALSLDMTGDGRAEKVVLGRSATDRWLALVGCQDMQVAVLGAFRMPGLVGQITVEPFAATRGPARELKVVLRAREQTGAQEFWAFFGFDGADLLQRFGWFVSHVPPSGDGTRAAVTFHDDDGDGTNEIRVDEEVLDGDGARAQLASATAPLPRIKSTRTLRFRYDTTRTAFVEVH